MGVRRPQRSKPDVRSTRAAYLICRASAPIQNGSSRLLISQHFLPKSVTTGRSRDTFAKQALLRSKCHHRTSARSAWGLRGADGDDDPQLQTARDRTAGAAGISALGFPARRDGGEVRHRHRRPRCGPPLPPCAPAWCPNPLSSRRGTDRAIGAVAACGGGAAGRISVSFELPSDRGVVTDRAMEAWYNRFIA